MFHVKPSFSGWICINKNRSQEVNWRHFILCLASNKDQQHRDLRNKKKVMISSYKCHFGGISYNLIQKKISIHSISK